MEGIGATIARPSLIESEMECGDLVRVFTYQTDVIASCSRVTKAAPRRRLEVEALRQWLLAKAPD